MSVSINASFPESKLRLGNQNLCFEIKASFPNYTNYTNLETKLHFRNRNVVSNLLLRLKIEAFFLETEFII